jgi:hypothetical protein
MAAGRDERGPSVAEMRAKLAPLFASGRAGWTRLDAAARRGKLAATFFNGAACPRTRPRASASRP